jgi:site-specific recombinase XerC
LCSPLRQEFTNEQADLSASSAHDRRHDHAQYVSEYARDLHHSVAQFCAFHRRSPDQLGVEQVRDFHLHLVSRGLTANSIGVKMAALRFFYDTTLRRPDIAAAIPTPRWPDYLGPRAGGIIKDEGAC